MYYYTCPHCGAALDPGERCDCQDENKEAASGATNTESGQKVSGIATPAHLHDTQNDEELQLPVVVPEIPGLILTGGQDIPNVGPCLVYKRTEDAAIPPGLYQYHHGTAPGGVQIVTMMEVTE